MIANYEREIYLGRAAKEEEEEEDHRSRLWRTVVVTFGVGNSVGRLVGWSVGRSVGPSVRNAFVKIAEKWTLRILNDLGSAGQGKKRDKEAGGTRRKEGRGE